MSFSFCYYNLYYRVFNANRIKSVLHNGKTIPYNKECEVKLKYTVLNDKNKFKIVQKYWGNILKSDYFFKEDKIIIREYEHGKLIKTITTPRK